MNFKLRQTFIENETNVVELRRVVLKLNQQMSSIHSEEKVQKSIENENSRKNTNAKVFFPQKKMRTCQRNSHMDQIEVRNGSKFWVDQSRHDMSGQLSTIN